MLLLTYLQTTYHLSRRSVVDFIKQGKILVNGFVVSSFKHELSVGDEVRVVNIQTIPSVPTKSPLPPFQKGGSGADVVLFNKPKGYVVSKSDPHNRTIYELLPVELQHYYYIGRLDKESRGLLLLTDTPQFVHQYEHPRFAIVKEYLIQLSSPLSLADQQRAKYWVHQEGELLKFKDIVSMQARNSVEQAPYCYKVILNEGKKRHIRRVMKALWYELLDLQRVKEGEWELGDLKEGEWRKVKVKG